MPKASGAHTGDISAAMLTDAGASHVILGHSERRADHGETDALVRAKAEAALAAGLVAIVCVGETEAERDAGHDACRDRRAACRLGPRRAPRPPTWSIAYEPVWAIGTGRTPTLAEIAEVHAFLRDRLIARFGAEAAGIRLLYGGSVKPSNAAEIFAVPHVDGALVGGASLKAADFGAIVAALSPPDRRGNVAGQHGRRDRRQAACATCPARMPDDRHAPRAPDQPSGGQSDLHGLDADLGGGSAGGRSADHRCMPPDH